MELKLRNVVKEEVCKAGFNRTFMELKSGFKAATAATLASFNRTFMELKFGRGCGHIHALGWF